MILASFFSWADRCESYLVENPEEKFSYDKAQMMLANYRDDRYFSDRQVCANSADPDQRSSLIWVYTVCHSICIIWTYYSMANPHFSIFKVYSNFTGVRTFRLFMVHHCTLSAYNIWKKLTHEKTATVNFLNIRTPKTCCTPCKNLNYVALP